jgi:hypothetical protein
VKHLCQKIFLRKNKKEKKTRIPLILSFPFVRSRLPLILSASRTRATGAVVLGFARDESDSRPRGDPARAHGAATRGRARRPGAGARHGHARAGGRHGASAGTGKRGRTARQARAGTARPRVGSGLQEEGAQEQGRCDMEPIG